MGPKALKLGKFASKKTKQGNLNSFFGIKKEVTDDSSGEAAGNKRPRAEKDKENINAHSPKKAKIKDPATSLGNKFSAFAAKKPVKKGSTEVTSLVSDEETEGSAAVPKKALPGRSKPQVMSVDSEDDSDEPLAAGVKREISQSTTAKPKGHSHVIESDSESERSSTKNAETPARKPLSSVGESGSKDSAVRKSMERFRAPTASSAMKSKQNDIIKDSNTPSGTQSLNTNTQSEIKKKALKTESSADETFKKYIKTASAGKGKANIATPKNSGGRKSGSATPKGSTGSDGGTQAVDGEIAVHYEGGRSAIRYASDDDNKGKLVAVMSVAKPYGREESKQFTPLENQYIKMKRKYPDAILFVECGYKFRFFDEDAKVAAKALNICCSNYGNMAGASIPVQRLPIHVRRLVELNYKVGVIGQTETAAIKATGTTKSGVFTRDLTAMYTKGTLVGESVNDGGGAEGSGTFEQLSFLLCINEIAPEDDKKGDSDTVKIGLLAVHVGTGEIVYDSFEDSCTRNQLHTRIAHLKPSEIVVSTGLSPRTQKAVMSYATTSFVRVECLKNTLTVEKADGLITDFYAASKSKRSAEEFVTAIQAMPDVVTVCYAYLIRYLKLFKLERVFRLSASKIVSFEHQGCMQLTSKTVANLELLANDTDLTEHGSLLQVVNFTKTQFGKRLMSKWITRPLTSARAINARLDAVTVLRDTSLPWLPRLRALLENMPDLEKGLTRVLYKKIALPEFWNILQALQKVCTTFACVEEDRDSVKPAVTTPEETAAHKSPQDDAEMLSEDNGTDIDESRDVEMTNAEGVDSISVPERKTLLDELLSVGMSEIHDHVLRFVGAISAKGAEANDKTAFLRRPEEHPDISKAQENINEIIQEIKVHRKLIRKIVGNPALEYVTVAGVEYLVEVTHAVGKKLPKDWIPINSTKKVGRYRTPMLDDLVLRLQEQRERLTIACEAAWMVMLEDFGEVYDSLANLTDRVATLDCLLSLADVSLQDTFCRPNVLQKPPNITEGDADINSDNGNTSKSLKSDTERGGEIYMTVKEGRHPMIAALINEKYVPNDVTILEDSRFLVITGPNMGGKSCYMKQVALLAIMAQIGSYVPAESCELCPFDAVHTRMGACDYIDKGVSTFMVELQDTAEILTKATSRSLVLVDELGRGTSTHDGVAIAYATSQSLIADVGCAVLFATHYPLLSQLEINYPTAVSNHYMDFFEEETTNDSGASEHAITFLYTLARGVANRSYGLNVARLADLPNEILRLAAKKSTELETQIRERGGVARDESVVFSKIIGLFGGSDASGAFNPESSDFPTAEAIVKQLEYTLDTWSTWKQ